MTTPATAANLAAVITTRMGGASSKRLIGLTNDESASSIGSDRLEGCCEDTIGLFRVKSGTSPDIDNLTHLAVLVPGVLYHLELYKGANSSFLDLHGRAFFAGCRSVAVVRKTLPQSTSNLSPSSDPSGSRPDMDRSLAVWKTGRRTPLPSEVEE